MSSPIVLVAGGPSAGKTTTSLALAAAFDRAVHIPVDRLRHLVVAGIALPAPDWSAELQRQLGLARGTAVRMAIDYAEAGFTVVIDDFFDPLGMREYRELLARSGVTGVLLVPSEAEARRRNAAREDGPDPSADRGIAHAAGFLAEAAERLAADGWLVLDTTELDVAATVTAILARVPRSTDGPPGV